MKKIIYGIALFVGIMLSASESATFLPNIIGMALFAVASFKLSNYLPSKSK